MRPSRSGASIPFGVASVAPVLLPPGAPTAGTTEALTDTNGTCTAPSLPATATSLSKIEKRVNGGGWSDVTVEWQTQTGLPLADSTFSQDSTNENTFEWRFYAANAAGEGPPSEPCELYLPGEPE